jgi:hypothetical protein
LAAVVLVAGFVSGFADDSFVALVSLAAGLALVSAPHHVLTPPCFEHAPCCVLALLNVPSLHSAVALFGAFAGFCANVETAITRTAATSEVLTKRWVIMRDLLT